MCKIKSLIIAISFVAVGLLLKPTPVSAAPLRLFCGDWTPYSSSNTKEPGITVEIVLAAFAAAGVETVLDFAPWPRCEEMIREGMDVAVFPYVQTPTRKRFARFSVPMLTERTYLYFIKRNLFEFDFTDYAALREYRVGTLNGFVHRELFEQNQVPARVVKNNTVGLKMLLKNRLDLFPMNDLVARHEIHTNFPEQSHLFRRSKTPLYEVSLHVMVSRENPRADRILSLFAKGMRTIRSKGTMARIMKRYE
jgi:polar amino acid transport system substrate-binding protein